MKSIVIALALVLFAGPARVVSAQDKLEDVKLGTHLAGPNFSADELKGRYVLVMDWTAHDQFPVPYIAYVTGLAEKYAKHKLAVIAVQSSTNTNEAVKQDWAKHAKNKRVMVTNRAEPPKRDGRTVHLSVRGKFKVAIYNGKGKLVWSEHARRLDEVLGDLFAGKQAMTDAEKQAAIEKRVYKRYEPTTALKVTGLELKHFKRDVDAINKDSRRSSYHFRNLRREIDRGRDEEKTAEAKAIFEKMQPWVDTQHARIKQVYRQDPVRAHFMVKSLRRHLPDDVMLKPTLEMVKGALSTPKIKNEAAAQELLDQAMLIAEYVGLTRDPAKAKANPWHKPVIEEHLPRRIESLTKKYAGTKAATQAKRLSRQWGLKEYR